MGHASKEYKSYARYMAERAVFFKKNAVEAEKRIESGDSTNVLLDKYRVVLNTFKEYGHYCCMLIDAVDCARELKIIKKTKNSQVVEDAIAARDWLYGFFKRYESTIYEMDLEWFKVKRGTLSDVEAADIKASQIIEEFKVVSEVLKEKALDPIFKLMDEMDSKISTLSDE